MDRQEYPKCLYRGDPGKLECAVVQNEQEHEAAKLNGFGPHPSTVKAPEPDQERPTAEPEAQPTNKPIRQPFYRR